MQDLKDNLGKDAEKVTSFSYEAKIPARLYCFNRKTNLLKLTFDRRENRYAVFGVLQNFCSNGMPGTIMLGGEIHQIIILRGNQQMALSV